MNKTELVASVSNKSGLSKKDSEKALSAVVETIVDAVGKEEKVQLVGFGTFEPRLRKERAGRDPRTNEIIVIPAAKVPAFKAGKWFKEAVASS
ncbi:MAG: HU family DNA-binding protein [Oscillospiraceae bacterium]|jgi:DNA-binding protein HU-beta|nr:HU family DNA-binding protein [Oscillospiraceae bacterium]